MMSTTGRWGAGGGGMGDSQKSYSILPIGDTFSGKMLPVHFRVRRGPLGYLSSMTKSSFLFPFNKTFAVEVHYQL